MNLCIRFPINGLTVAGKTARDVIILMYGSITKILSEIIQCQPTPTGSKDQAASVTQFEL